MRLSSTRTVTVERAGVALPVATNATATITISSETFCISSPSGIEKGCLASLRRTVGRVIGAGTGLVCVPARKCGVDARGPILVVALTLSAFLLASLFAAGPRRTEVSVSSARRCSLRCRHQHDVDLA